MVTININYQELNKSLYQLKEDYPSRMHGNIDLLRANIRDHLLDFLVWDNFIVTIDDEKKEALIWWKEIEWDIYAIYNHRLNPTTSQKMYEQILEAKEQAKKLWIYEKVFTESNDNENADETKRDEK